MIFTGAARGSATITVVALCQKMMDAPDLVFDWKVCMPSSGVYTSQLLQDGQITGAQTPLFRAVKYMAQICRPFRKCIIWKCCLTISKIKCFRRVVWGGRESWRFRVPHPYSSVRVTKPWEATSNLEYYSVSTDFCFHLQGSHWNW